MRPKVAGSLKLAFGGAKLGVLVKLKNSARKSKYFDSVRPNFLLRLRSQFLSPGARRIPTPADPKVPDAGRLKAAELIHRSSVGLSTVGSPIKFGRAEPRPPCNDWSAAVTVIGKPERNCTMLPRAQPPRTPLTMGFHSLPKARL